MANKSKAKLAVALQAAGIPQKSFTIPQFCARHSFSEGFYRGMRKRGLGPRETHFFDLVRITEEAEEEWLRAGAAESAAENDAT
jgi:hypothetical protein